MELGRRGPKGKLVTETTRLVIRRPDDWHVHLRDGDMLRAVAGHTARQFARAIVMPNLVPPVTTVAAAEAYRARILEKMHFRNNAELMHYVITNGVLDG